MEATISSVVPSRMRIPLRRSRHCGVTIEPEGIGDERGDVTAADEAPG